VKTSAAPEAVQFTADRGSRIAAFSNDGRWLAIANWNSPGATVWAADTGKQVCELPIGRHGGLAFSPDGRWLATTPGGVQLWRVADWRLVRSLNATGDVPSGMRIAFSTDSRVLAIGQPNGVVRLVDPDTGRDWAQLTHPESSGFLAAAFSSDQTRLVTLPTDPQLPALIWNLASLRRQLAERGLDWPSDVLRAAGKPAGTSVPLHVIFDDGGLLRK
jgi:WD40 repeat protein